jgi:hypothetical protein
MSGGAEGCSAGRVGLAKTALIGAIAGLGGGLVSLGGGTLVIPLLMGWLGLDPLLARGTAMVVAVFSAGMGTLVYARGGMLDLAAVLWVALPSFFIAPLAARFSARWSARRLKAGFGLVVILGGALVIARDLLPGDVGVPEAWQPGYLLFIGTFEGLVAGIIGISGGPILAPLFVLGLGMPQQLAQGCSLAARLPAVLSGTWENWRLGSICWRLVPALALGAMLGAWTGSATALFLPEHYLRLVFGLLLIALGGRYLYEGIRRSGQGSSDTA